MKSFPKPSLETYSKQLEAEYEAGWRDVMEHLPWLRFPSNWEVKITPPFGGAAARFRVRCGAAEVSVFLDTQEQLGYAGGECFWETYPHDGDTARCDLEAGDNLLQFIAESIEQQATHPASAAGESLSGPANRA